MENTDAHWKMWGRIDPYRAVLFERKYKRDALDENTFQEFFKTGKEHVECLMEKLSQLNPKLSLDTAVDFGCGVGRLVIPLAGRFQKVIGVDVSPDMLNESRKNCSRFGVFNAEFALSDDLVSRVPLGVQLVHSFLVLQHIPVGRGLSICANLIKRLAPGGACALHVPIDRDPSLLKKLVYFGKHVVPPSRYLLNFLQRKTLNEPLMQVNPYPIRAMYEVLASAGMRDISLWPFVESHCSVIWFGTKE
jgi:trans-aconitate methyltransferase